MAFIIDDLAIAATAAEAATAATEATAAVEAVEATTSVEATMTTEAVAGATTEAVTAEATAAESTVATESTTTLDAVSKSELPTVEGDIVSPESKSGTELPDTFVDEFPEADIEHHIPTETEGFGENVFFDEFPSEIHSEANPVTETTSEVSQEVETPKTYEEFCETRDCGGSYKDLKNEGWGWNDNPAHEVHHMPADSVSPLEREDGPAIAIDYDDHQQTASCGSSREAKEYRAAQQELIDKGDFREALQMDIDDLHDKFGDKYNEAISQMLDYVDKLEQAGKI